MAQQHGRRRTGSGGKASVGRRGSSVGSRPVGKTGGYSGRTSSGYSGGTRSGMNMSGGSGCITTLASLGVFSLLKKNKTVRTIVIILAIVLVLWFLFGNGSCAGMSCGSMTGGNESLGIYDSLDIAGTVSDEQEPDLSVSGMAREKYSSYPSENASFTIMIYMCGTDLESQHGMATSDLKEMIGAKISDDVNIIVETGGTKAWKNKTISSSKNQIFKVTSEGMTLLKETGKKSMVDPETLTDFINYCTENYEADRYALIFWDHGGGSVSGYGYDQNFPEGSMTLDEIDTALEESGCKFDFIGFDACLMATLETAIVSERYADYLIASEETEPGVGWYYTEWLNALSSNTSMPTVELGKEIIDSFVEMSAKQAPGSKTTLSIVDLAELSGTVPESFKEFALSTSELIDDDNYKQISNARSSVREFSSNINQVDLIDLANRIGTSESKAFAKVLRSCVKYNRTSSNMTNANGISIYFPYGSSKLTSSALKTYDKIGIDDSYSDCIKDFASVTAGGQIAAGGSGSLMDSLFGSMLNGSGSSSSTTTSSAGSLLDVIDLLGGNTSSSSSSSNGELLDTMFDLFLKNKKSKELTGIDVGQGEDWFDSKKVKSYKSYIKNNYLDPDRVVITENEEGKEVVSLTEEEWDLVQTIELNVFYDDGEGYIDLGMDNIFTRDEKTGDLYIDYDGQWVALNGQVACYYMLSEEWSEDGEQYVITGYIPALLDGELVQLIVVFAFDGENDSTDVIGYRPVYEDPTAPSAKIITEIKTGAKIDLVCDFYSYDQEYSDSYTFGNTITVGEDGLKVSDVELVHDDGSILYSYCLTDIYGNRIWTAQTEF